MKRKRNKLGMIVGVLLAVLILCPPAQAAPFLVCDWMTGVQASEVEVNGVVQPGTVTQSGTDMILLDLQGYANGAYVFRARFIGTGGWPSEWSAPLAVEKPAGAGNVRIKR